MLIFDKLKCTFLMKKTYIILFILVFQIGHAGWFYNFEDAQKISLATNKFMLIDFTAKWCGPCKKMELNSWSNEQILNLLENYIIVKLDVDLNRDLAIKDGVKSIPNIFVMDGNGFVVHRANALKS